jgi:hypothetical protein
MSQPLAVLSYEEMHWLTTSVSLINGVGSIIVTSVTNTADISLCRTDINIKIWDLDLEGK